MKRKSRILATALLAAAAPIAYADTWNNSTGNGSWSTGANWLDGTAPTPGDTALFPSPSPASNIVNLTASTTVKDFQFNDDYTLQGSSQLSANLGNYSVAAGQVATINAPLSQSDLNKNGDGTLALGGANNVGGYVNINAGTLRVASDANLGSGVFGTVRLYATLEAAGTFSTTKYIHQLGGNIRVLTGNTLTLASNGQLDSGGGTLVKNGDGTLDIGGHNSRIGTTTVNAGTLRVQQFAQPGYGAITLNGTSTLELINRTWSGGIVLSPAATIRGTGISNVSNMTFASGDVFPTLATASSGDTMMATFTNTAATANSLITIAGPGTVTPHVNGSTFYLGTWQVNSGTMRLFGNSYLGPNTAPIVVNSGGTVLWDQTGFNKAVTLNTGGTVCGKGISGPGVVTVSPSASVTLSTTALADQLMLTGTNRLTGGAGATITVDGPGKVWVQGSNNYAGGWSINNGTLRGISSGASLGTGTSAIAMNGGTLEFSAMNLSRDIAFNAGTLRGSGGGNSAGGVVTVAPGANVSLGTTGGGSTLTIGDSPNDLTGGDASTYVHINGGSPGGRVILAQPSNLACNWLIDSGVLQVTDDAQLGAASNTVTLNTFGTLATFADANYARNLSAQGGAIDTMSFTMGLQNISGSGFSKMGLGTLEIDQVRATSMNVFSGTVKVNHDGTSAGTSKLNSLTMSGSQKLDLTNNALVLVNQSAGTWDGSAYTGAIGLVAGGRIMTSEPDAAMGLTALVAMNASDAGYNAPATFRGVSIDPSDVLVAYTWGGDANLDGELNGDDYFALDSHILQSGSVFGYHNGDFNYDGELNGDDYFVIDSNILYAQNSTPFPTGLAAVPEPAGLGLLAAFSAGLLARRRRNMC